MKTPGPAFPVADDLTWLIVLLSYLPTMDKRCPVLNTGSLVFAHVTAQRQLRALRQRRIMRRPLRDSRALLCSQVPGHFRVRGLNVMSKKTRSFPVVAVLPLVLLGSAFAV